MATGRTSAAQNAKRTSRSLGAWIPGGLALLAALLYMAQSWVYIHSQDSLLDEGAYLYKGLAHLTGQFSLYQEYGAWSNHMPLSFLIPGFLQKIFGPGLAAPRYFTLVTGALMLLGVWICARRLGGRWAAALAVLAIAWNPATIKMYSVAVTQGLIACMFVWTLVLVIGEGRTQLQILLGSALAGVMMMTRINMSPVLPLLLLYVAWQHGFKTALLAALSAGVVVVVGHAAFWPRILQMWAYWLPSGLTPFLDAWRPPAAIKFWTADLPLIDRLTSFTHSLRFQFVPMAGALITWLLWPRKESWREGSNFRSAVFLSVTFVVLLLLHIQATLAQDYCVYCLPGYVAFFAPAGLLLAGMTYPMWRKRLPWWAQAAIVLLVLTLSAGIGFGAFEDIGLRLTGLPISRLLLGEPARFAESVTLGEVLINKFGLVRQTLIRGLSLGFGLSAGVGVALLALGIWIITRRRRDNPASYAYWVLVVALLAGFIFSPSLVLGGGYRSYDCDRDVIQAYRTGGEHLASLIPPGSSVYWRGRLSAITLAYIPGIRIYPPQLNGDYTIRIGGNPQELERYGFWNEELARQWAAEANYILVARHYYEGWLQDWVNAGGYDELEPTPSSAHCSQDAQIRVFRRKQ